MQINDVVADVARRLHQHRRCDVRTRHTDTDSRLAENSSPFRLRTKVRCVLRCFPFAALASGRFGGVNFTLIIWNTCCANTHTHRQVASSTNMYAEATDAFVNGLQSVLAYVSFAR